MWGLTKQTVLHAKAFANGGWLPRPNLATIGMHGLMWDAAQRMERKKPLAVPELSDAAKIVKAVNQRGRELVDLSSHMRRGNHQKSPVPALALASAGPAKPRPHPDGRGVT